MSEERRYELAQWRDPDDDDPNRRSPKLVRGIRRYSVLHNLHKSDDQAITLDHMKSVARLVADFEMGILGASAPGDSKMEVVDGTKNYDVPEMRLKRATSFRAAKAALGPRNFAVLEVVVFDNQSVIQLGVALGCNKAQAKGRLVACLDSLYDHYNPSALSVPVSAGYEYVDDAVAERRGRFERVAESS